MEDSAHQLPGCATSNITQINGNQTSEQNRVGNNRVPAEGNRDRVAVSKAFDGSPYYRQSNLILNGKQRQENRFEELQRNGHHYPVAGSLSQIQIKAPPIVVSSELPTQKSSEAGHNVNGTARSSENASYLERLKRSFPSSGGHMSSDSQETAYDKFSRRSRELSQKKEKYSDDVGGKKEHSPKSVSFASSVKDLEEPMRSTSPDKGLDGSVRHGPTRNDFAMPRAHRVQSNVVLTDGIREKLFGPGLQNSDTRRSFDHKPKQQTTAMESKYYDAGDVPLPPSPPTRDTNKAPNHRDSHSGSVQVLSLYNEKSLFASNFSQGSGSFPRQSNIGSGFSESTTSRSSAGSSFGPKRDTFVQQSNSKVDFTPSSSLRASRDASLTLEELLSSGSVKSSPENSPSPTKLASQFEKTSLSSKKEHSLDDYEDEKGGLLQDLRYSGYGCSIMYK